MAEICYISEVNSIQQNKLVHALTNYSSGFADTYFADTSAFTPEPQSKEWERVRAALGLDIREHNQLLFMVLQGLHSKPMLMDLLEGHVPAYDIRLFPKEFTTLSDARFVDGPTHGTALEPQTFPIYSEYEVRYENESLVRVKFGTAVRDLRYTKLSLPNPSSSLNMTRLQIEWRDIPMAGPILVDGPWVDGRTFDISYRPPRVDPDRWLEYVLTVAPPSSFLAPVGLFEEYNHAMGSSERLAIYSMALALQNTSMESWQQT